MIAILERTQSNVQQNIGQLQTPTRGVTINQSHEGSNAFYQIFALDSAVVEVVITLELYRIFGSKCAYLFFLLVSIHSGMQNGGEGLTSTILTGQCVLVEMLIIFEPHGIF